MLAFAIPTNQTKQAKTWLLARVPLIRQGDQDEFTSESWHATSFYFRDPAGHILELIAHHDLPDTRPGPFGGDELLYISEIGMAFANVTRQVESWKTAFGLEPYRNALSEVFAAIGDIHGLFITVQSGRNWFSTSTDAATISGRSHNSER